MRSRIRIGSFALLAAFMMPACSDILMDEPLEFPGGVEYYQRPEFPQWWADLQTCSGITRDIHAVHFFHVASATLPGVLHGIRTLGVYFPNTDRIFVIDAEKTNPAVIRHEMMHALLKDESGHPPKYFGTEGVCGYL
ncbi:MAG: hypothetical protein ACJ770_14110 [Gemmatimonadaceae bacterium]